LGSLRDLDLQVIGADEVFARHAKPRRCHLFDRASTGIAVRIAPVARRVLAPLAAVRLAADAIHRDRKGLVRLLADRPVRHCARRETLQNRLDRLHLVYRNGLRRRFHLEQTTESAEASALIVDERRVLTIDRVLTAAGCVLELVNGVGVEQMSLAITLPL